MGDNLGMKRDLDLIREILLFTEQHSDGSTYLKLDVSKLPEKYHSLNIIDEDDDDEDDNAQIFTEHITLAVERGLLEASRNKSGYTIHRLTWEGHEFLANAREPSVWNAAKAAAGQASFSVFVGVLTQLATSYTTDSFKSWLKSTLASLGGS